MGVHNQIASVANLARGYLQSIDRKSLETSVQTQSLILMLTTLVELAQPQHDVDVGAASARTIMGHMTVVSEAEKARV